MYVDLAPHQLDAMKRMKNGCILWGGVGTGKTITSLAYYLNCESPEDLYVITTAKKRDSLDWEGEAAKFGIGKEKGASVAGLLHVDSWNNIGKYTDVSGAFFIFDEQRLVGSGAWVKSFLKIAKKNQWVLLSATPGDTWLDYIPVFIANGFYKNQTEFKREHVIYNTFSKFPKVDRYVGVGKLVRLRNSILIHMPYQRHTVREEIDVKCKYDQDLFLKAVTARWHVYEHRPLRNVAELFLVMRKIVNSDASRLDAVREIMKEHPRLIVFYTFDYELEILRTLGDEPWPTTSKTSSTKSKNGSQKKLSEKRVISLSGLSSPQTQTSTNKNLRVDSLHESTKSRSVESKDATDNSQNVVIAEWNGHKHEDIPETERWVYLVQYTSGSESWNCITTDAMVFYSLTYSYKLWEQAHGRIDRMNTPYSELWYYILMSNSFIDKAIRKALDGKKNFQESKVEVKEF